MQVKPVFRGTQKNRAAGPELRFTVGASYELDRIKDNWKQVTERLVVYEGLKPRMTQHWKRSVEALHAV